MAGSGFKPNTGSVGNKNLQSHSRRMLHNEGLGGKGPVGKHSSKLGTRWRREQSLGGFDFYGRDFGRQLGTRRFPDNTAIPESQGGGADFRALQDELDAGISGEAVKETKFFEDLQEKKKKKRETAHPFSIAPNNIPGPAQMINPGRSALSDVFRVSQESQAQNRQAFALEEMMRRAMMQRLLTGGG